MYNIVEYDEGAQVLSNNLKVNLNEYLQNELENCLKKILLQYYC